jgi:hypothetical protein
MGSLTPSVRVRNVPAPASSLPLSNGVINNNGGHHASNGYMDHLHEELAVFESDVFDAQAYVEAKCQSMSEKVCFLSEETPTMLCHQLLLLSYVLSSAAVLLQLRVLCPLGLSMLMQRGICISSR